MSLRLLILPFLAALTLSGVGATALADPGPSRRGDHDDALAAVASGEALPLPRILQIVARHVPGEVVEVELDRSDGRLIYEVEVLTSSGRIREIDIDARTGAVIEVEDED